MKSTVLQRFCLGLSVAVLAGSLFYGLDKFVHQKPSSTFDKRKIVNVFPSKKKWEISKIPPSEEQEIEKVLNQQFKYYSKGSQAYVFLSEDGKHVIKFLKMHKFKPLSWLAYIPASWNSLHLDLQKKNQKAELTFNALKTAYTELKRESALLYLQINKSKSSRPITLIDKKGQKQKIDLNKTIYLVQKKADLIYPSIERAMRSHDIEKAKLLITRLLYFLDALGEKGIVDNDPIIRRNFGFVEDMPVQFDIGKLKIDPIAASTKNYKKDIRRITQSFHRWVDERFPDLSQHFEDVLEKVSEENF